ncbi:hypothetical protein C496_14827 [Natronorubrum tibetense GA33]|uniref:Uncharacterized protein n=1 Tax=Natronorubrum tibetense GA33 TaxID=1114856 RepID=L9VQ17_9EURY|nr:hypothetical protein C496_14827 [Natronorubrum tibetense GA33]
MWTIVAVVGRINSFPIDQNRRPIDGQFLEGACKFLESACKVERFTPPDDRPCHGSTVDHLVVSGNPFFI